MSSSADNSADLGFGFFDDAPAVPASPPPPMLPTADTQVAPLAETSTTPAPAVAAAAQSDKFLLFSCRAQRFGLPVEKVMEVSTIQPVTRLPVKRKNLAGYLTLRGEAIPVLDLAQVLGDHLVSSEVKDFHNIIIGQFSGGAYALPVEKLHHVATLDAASRKPADAATVGRMSVGSHVAFEDGVAIIILDIDQVLVESL